MKQNHFYIPYLGNKRNEVVNLYNKIEKYILNDEVNYIVEPFCGSCSISYYIWLKNKDNNKITYILNDNNKYLYEMYLILKDDNKIKEFENIIKEKIIYINKEKEKYKNVCKEENIYGWFIKHKYYYIHPSLFPSKRLCMFDNEINLKKYPIYEFFNKANIKYNLDDGLNIYKKYKDNIKAFIILDPPYIISCNIDYENQIDMKKNIYDYLYFNKIDNEKAKIYLILEDNFIIRILFNDNIINSYDKKYAKTQKKTNHLLISNIKYIN